MALKTQVITNTWKCDSCGAEQTVEVNPFFQININLERFKSIEIDYCETCIAQLTAQSVVDFVASIPS